MYFEKTAYFANLTCTNFNQITDILESEIVHISKENSDSKWAFMYLYNFSSFQFPYFHWSIQGTRDQVLAIIWARETRYFVSMANFFYDGTICQTPYL